MVFGGPASDRFLLNDSTLWTGRPVDPAVNPDAINWLPKVREALFRGDYKAADTLTRRIQGKFSQSYAPLGDLFIDAPGIAPEQITGYRRELNLDTAVARTTFAAGDTRMLREAFVSYPDKLLVIRLSASAPGRLAFALRFTSQLRHEVTVASNGDLLLAGRAPVHAEPNYRGSIKDPVSYDEGPNPKGTRFAARARILLTDGKVGRGPDTVTLEGATTALVAVAVDTSFAGFDKEPSDGPDPVRATLARLDGAAGRTFGSLRAAHEKDCRGACPARRAGSRPDAAGREAHRCSLARLRGGRTGPGPRGPLLSVRPLPAHQRFAARQPGAQPAGDLEPAHAAAVEQQLHGQHQHRDELLAGRDDQPRRVPSAAAALHRRPREDRRGDGAPLLRGGRLVRPSQQRHLGAQQPGRRFRPGRPALGQLADGGRVAEPAPVGALRLRRRHGVAARHRVSAHEGCRPVRDGLAGGGARRVPGDGALHVARKRVHDARRLHRRRLGDDDRRSCAHPRAVSQRDSGRGYAGRRCGVPIGGQGDAGSAAALQGRPPRQSAGVVSRLGRPGAGAPPRVAPDWPVSRRPDHSRWTRRISRRP